MQGCRRLSLTSDYKTAMFSLPPQIWHTESSQGLRSDCIRSGRNVWLLPELPSTLQGGAARVLPRAALAWEEASRPDPRSSRENLHTKTHPRKALAAPRTGRQYLCLNHAWPLVPQVLQCRGNVDLFSACNKHKLG